MKILKLLNKINLSIIFFLLVFIPNSYGEDEPVDIWNTDKKKIEDTELSGSLNSETQSESLKISETDIYNSQSQKQIDKIKLEKTTNSKRIKIIGLYDPEDYSLDIDMWSNSDGDQIKSILSKLSKLELSDDASYLLNIALLTNSYPPNKNISNNEFLEFKSNWLIKNSDLNLIKKFLIKNQIINSYAKLTKYFVDQNLSVGNIEEACEVFKKNLEPIDDFYLTKFNIYCLIHIKKNEEAQLFLDLKKELGFKDKYFEQKIDYLQGYVSENSNTISEKSILDFHLAHKTSSEFSFEPKDNTDKIIWKYLSSLNLLNTFQEIEVSELEKISLIEKAVHDKNYPEKELLEIYKRFQFNINQLLNAKESYKSLSDIEARALIYQKILLESEKIEKLKLLKLLKSLFKKSKINNAFDLELKKFLERLDPTEIPDNLTSFYYTNIEIKKKESLEKKFNKDVLHQSKLINYFNGDYPKSKIEKDVNNFLKKIKKNKKYFFSKKDQIFLESLKIDGIEISKKYEDLYEPDDNQIPSDIQIMINNNEKGLALLRIAEVIGQDKLERIDDDTIYFIIRTLNQLNINSLRNKILLKVLPLKV